MKTRTASHASRRVERLVAERNSWDVQYVCVRVIFCKGSIRSEHSQFFLPRLSHASCFFSDRNVGWASCIFISKDQWAESDTWRAGLGLERLSDLCWFQLFSFCFDGLLWRRSVKDLTSFSFLSFPVFSSSDFISVIAWAHQAIVSFFSWASYIYREHMHSDECKWCCVITQQEAVSYEMLFCSSAACGHSYLVCAWHLFIGVWG